MEKLEAFSDFIMDPDDSNEVEYIEPTINVNRDDGRGTES